MRHFPNHGAWAKMCGFGLLLGALAAPPALAEGDASVIDPKRYLKIDWNGEHLVEPCDAGSCPRAWKVIGLRGDLMIDLDRERIKSYWDFTTRGELSIRGFVFPAGGDSNAQRAFEIPKYSVIGEEPQPPPLDLSRASALVRQLSDGAILASRFIEARSQAELAALRARIGALDELIAAQEELLRITELALRRVYNAALDFRLSPKELKEAAGEIQAAEEFLTSRQRPEEAALAAKLKTFFDVVELHRTAVQTWLDQLLADENARYLPILAEIVGRPEEVIRQVAQDIRQKYQDASLGLDQETQIATMHQIIDKAEILQGMQAAIYVKYKNNASLDDMMQKKQVQESAPTGFDPRALRTPEEILEPCRPAPKPYRVEPPPARDLAKEAELKAKDRLAAIATLLRELTGPGNRFEQVSAKAVRNFTAQILEALQKIEDLRRERAGLDEPIFILEQQIHGWETAKKDPACVEPLLVQKSGLEALIMLDFFHQLVDQIEPVTLNLADLDLQEGDRVKIEVSLSKDTDNQTSIDFQAVPWGWRGPRPRIKEVFTFVEADVPDSDFAPRPGVSALWNFYGHARQPKSTLRTIAPGIGIGATFLDFDGDESTIEVGLGVTVSFFDDLLHLTYGYNLQETAGPDDSRQYWGVGVSLSQVVEKLSGQ